MAANISDVAKMAGVSVATVSRVLNNTTFVTEEARQRVLAAVSELNYQPSRVAKSLRAQTSQIIGLIISDIQNPFFTAIVRAVEDVAYQYKYTCFLCNSDEDPKKEALYLELMQSENVAGVIITPSREDSPACLQLLQRGIPLVAVDRRLTNAQVDTVVVDNFKASYELTTHLIQQGHRKIGAIFGSLRITTGRERHDGFIQALRDNAIPVQHSMVRTAIPRENEGYRLTNELLDLPERPTAIFTGNNLLTSGALIAIEERGLRIPADMALVVFDEMEWMRLVKPPITVITQPTYELGNTAATLLINRIKNPALSVKEVVLKPKIYLRESSALKIG